MTWDEVKPVTWNGRPNSWYFSTSGCGCCADYKTVDDPQEVIKLLKEHIEEREAELVDLRIHLNTLSTL